MYPHSSHANSMAMQMCIRDRAEAADHRGHAPGDHPAGGGDHQVPQILWYNSGAHGPELRLQPERCLLPRSGAGWPGGLYLSLIHICLTPASIAACSTLSVPMILVCTACMGKNSQDGTCFNADVYKRQIYFFNYIYAQGFLMVRNSGIAWEPGVFQILMNLGLSISVACKERLDYKRIIVYSLAVILTRSTTGRCV